MFMIDGGGFLGCVYLGPKCANVLRPRNKSGAESRFLFLYPVPFGRLASQVVRHKG